MSTLNDNINSNTKQSKQGLNDERPGFKHTKLGWIPETWGTDKLKNIAVVQTGIQKGAKKEGKKVKLPYLRVANVQDGHLNLSEIKYIEVLEDKVERYLLKKGDVLMTEGGDFDKLGRGTIWNSEIKNCLHQNHVFAVRPDQEILLPYFLNAFSSSEHGKFYFKLCSKQSTNLASINSSQLKNFIVPLPSKPEQELITTCLSTWDKAIQTLTKLIEQKELRKKGLMQQLLTGKKSLPGFSGEWKKVKLGRYFSERKETGFDDLPLLSVGEAGVYPQTESNKKDTSNNDKTKYKRICKGDIGYNTMRMWQGRSALSQLEGIVSPAYTILHPKDQADSEFFSYLFKLPKVVFKFYRNSQGLVSDTLNCKYKDFAIVKVMLPPTIEEQIAIAKVMQTADTEIKLLKTKLNKLQQQKKGMMQQLLTGKKRLINE